MNEDSKQNSGLEKAFRYGLAAIGPIATAGSQFVLSLQLLHFLDIKSFGSFAFLLVTSQFSSGVWSALFCAPLPVLVTQGSAEQRQTMLRCLFATNLVLATAAFFVFWALGEALGVAHGAAALFAGYGAFALLRWFGRAYAYVTGHQIRATMSDLLYSLALLAGLATIYLTKSSDLYLPNAALMASAILSLLPFGGSYLLQQFVRLSFRDIPRYRQVWRRHSSWSLTGVVTTEATANAHAYIVTFFLGPTAFAPLSASALLIRPISVVMNALTDFERPQMARQLDAGNFGGALHSQRTFRIAMIGIWALTVLAATALIIFAPRLIFPERYAINYLAVAAALWMAVAGMRSLRTADSVLLQAGGVFRELAYASMISSGVSVLAVIALLVWGGPLWSIAGILVGEAVYAAWIWREAARWRHRQSAAGSDGAGPTAASPEAARAQPRERVDEEQAS
ncbi:lipopolysaccharide biosynthesis protein [Bradyrhizobium betae]|uniref:lipopolysaccharide biosynthesis protein n=1 Tax=Bradyrhizobium betae TaxID=244734 RepID=UPI003D67F426